MQTINELHEQIDREKRQREIMGTVNYKAEVAVFFLIIAALYCAWVIVPLVDGVVLAWKGF